MADLYYFYQPDKHTTRIRPVEGIPRELSSERGAKALALEIEAWWHSRGYPQVKAWVPSGPMLVSSKGNIWSVKTNLILGMPPRVGLTVQEQIEEASSGTL
jgi:hypothetical protein